MRLRILARAAAALVIAVVVLFAGLWLLFHCGVREMAYSDVPMELNAAQRLSESKSALKAATEEYDRWLALGDIAFWSVDAGELAEATAHAEELLQLAKRYTNDWNYGNAIHKANLALGRVALRNGNKEAAIRYLHLAGQTRGSPQLNSFGPNVLLAKELLEAGEKDAVLKYFDLCGAFWQFDWGALSIWKEMIEAGRRPNFGANLLY